MLVALGLLTATSLFYAQAAKQSAKQRSDSAAELALSLKAQISSLGTDNDALRAALARMTTLLDRAARTADDRSQDATRQRAEVLQEIARLRVLILKILANSRDPEVRRGARAEASASASPSPRPSTTSRPTPSPTPTCRVLVQGRCVVP